jgi:hypothetical protein
MPPRPRAVVVLLVAGLMAGCSVVSHTPPAPTPADFLGISSTIVRQGIAVDLPVSGDAGCSDPALAKTAISFRASGLDQPAPTPVHLYIFGSRDAYDRLKSSIADCARSYAADPATLEVVDAPPFVLVGAGPWGPKFTTAIQAALREAAGNGG